MIHYMLLLGYILVACHKNNIVTLHVTFMLYRRNKTCLLGMVCAKDYTITEKYAQIFYSGEHIIFPKINFTEWMFCRNLILPNCCLAEKKPHRT